MCLPVCLSVCLSLCMCVCLCVCLCACGGVCMYVLHMYACGICVHTYVCDLGFDHYLNVLLCDGRSPRMYYLHYCKHSSRRCIFSLNYLTKETTWDCLSSIIFHIILIITCMCSFVMPEVYEYITYITAITAVRDVLFLTNS